jgi:hypothetical protein
MLGMAKIRINGMYERSECLSPMGTFGEAKVDRTVTPLIPCDPLYGRGLEFGRLLAHDF